MFQNTISKNSIKTFFNDRKHDIKSLFQISVSKVYLRIYLKNCVSKYYLKTPYQTLGHEHYLKSLFQITISKHVFLYQNTISNYSLKLLVNYSKHSLKTVYLNSETCFQNTISKHNFQTVYQSMISKGTFNILT